MINANLSALFSVWLLADSCSIEPLKSNYMALETRFLQWILWSWLFQLHTIRLMSKADFSCGQKSSSTQCSFDNHGQLFEVFRILKHFYSIHHNVSKLQYYFHCKSIQASCAAVQIITHCLLTQAISYPSNKPAHPQVITGQGQAWIAQWMEWPLTSNWQADVGWWLLSLFNTFLSNPAFQPEGETLSYLKSACLFGHHKNVNRPMS